MFPERPDTASKAVAADHAPLPGFNRLVSALSERCRSINSPGDPPTAPPWLFQAQTTLPLWVHRQGLSTGNYGLLLALNSALIMTLQLPATRVMGHRRPQPVIAATSIVVGAGFGLLSFAHTAVLLAVAVTVWSLGELTQWPVAAAFTTSLAPPGMTARYAGARSLCYGTALLLAPLAGTSLYRVSPGVLWAGCAAAGISAAAVMAPRRGLIALRRTQGSGRRQRGQPAAASSTRTSQPGST